jgi:hypothetical protein
VGEAKAEVEDSMEVLASEVSESASLQSELTVAEDAVQQHRDKLEILLDAGSGELSEEYSDATEVVSVVSEKSEAVITDTLGGGKDDTNDASNNEEYSFTLETDLESVATELVGGANDNVNTSAGQSTQQGSDKLSETLSVSIPHSDPAITQDAEYDEIVTIESSDLLGEEDIDPVINPSVEVDLPSARVPAPGLSVDPSTFDVETTEAALERTQDTVSDIRGRLQTLENAVIESGPQPLIFNRKRLNTTEKETPT